MRFPLTLDDTLGAGMDRMMRYNMTDCCTTQRPNTNWAWPESAETGAGATSQRQQHQPRRSRVNTKHRQLVTSLNSHNHNHNHNLDKIHYSQLKQSKLILLWMVMIVLGSQGTSCFPATQCVTEMLSETDAAPVTQGARPCQALVSLLWPDMISWVLIQILPDDQAWDTRLEFGSKIKSL